MQRVPTSEVFLKSLLSETWKPCGRKEIKIVGIRGYGGHQEHTESTKQGAHDLTEKEAPGFIGSTWSAPDLLCTYYSVQLSVFMGLLNV